MRKGEKRNWAALIRKPSLTAKVKRSMKRAVSLALTVSMVLSGFPGIPASIAAVDDTTQAFELSSVDLKEAIEKAMRGGTPISEYAYAFTGAESEAYDELFNWRDVYEITQDIQVDTEGALSLKIFVKEDGDQQLDSYRFTGDEEMIFLVMNGTHKDKTARIYIDGMATEVINVSAKNAVVMENSEAEEELAEITVEAQEQDESLEEDIAQPETEAVIGPGAPAGHGTDAAAGATGGPGIHNEGTMPETDDIPRIDPFIDTPGETGSGIIGPGSGSEQDHEQAPDFGETGEDAAEDDESFDKENDGETSGSYDDGYTGSESGQEHGSDSGSGSESSSESDSESGSDGGSESGSESDSESSGSGSESGSGSGSDGGSASDSGSDSGSSSGSSGSDGGSSSDSGSNSSSSSSSDGGSGSDSGSSSDGGSQSASISSHNIGLLAASLDDVVVITDEGGYDVSGNTDIVIESEDISDEEYIIETEVRLASASDAESTDEDDNDDYWEIDGTIYESVLINRKRAAAAFVTTLEGLGLRMNDVDRRPDIELEDQYIKVDIYRDSDYGWKFTDGTTISLSGMMPVNAVAKAYPVEVEIEDIHVLAAYDITIFDEDGYEYQTEDNVIEVEIENDAIREALDDEHELTIFHMEDEGDDPEEVAVIEPEEQIVTFSAERFSIYVVGEDGSLTDIEGEDHYIYTLKFYLGDVPDEEDDDEDYVLLSTQVVSPGEKVEMPNVPDREHYEFIGWYSEPDGGGEKYDFYNDSMPEIIDNNDHEIDLYAHYAELYYVHFMTHDYKGDDSRVIFHSEAYSKGQALDTKNAEDLYLAEGYLSYIDETTGALIIALAVTGWLDADGNKWVTGDEIDWDFIDGDLELYPVVEGAYWVYYDMNGHDSIENPVPEYVLASEEVIGTLPDTEVSGYSLAGWYTEPEGGNEVKSTTALADIPKNIDGSITLYAHWTKAKVAYTINIWRQKAIEGEDGINSKVIQNGETYDDYIKYYDYAESHYVTAEQSNLYTGDTPTTNTVYNWSAYTGYGTTTNENSDYYGFEYGTNTTARTRTLNNLAAITMASDGSTIINIFYNRVTITWTFGSGRDAIQRTGLYDTACDWPEPENGQRWYTGNNSYSFEAKFKILDNSTSKTFSSRSYSGVCYAYYYLEVTNEAAQVVPGGDKETEANDYNVSYTKTVGGIPYVYDRRIRINSNFNIESKYIGYEYLGYNKSDGATTIQSNGTLISPSRNEQYFFFNTANTFTVTLLSDNKVVGVDGAGDAVETTAQTTYRVKYGEDLSNYPFPEEMEAKTWGPAYYYTFKGWYEDPSLTSSFTTAVMPNNNLVAYAKWAPRDDIEVTFNTGTKEVEPPRTQIISAAQKAEDPGVLERTGYTHVGWINRDSKVFNFDTLIYDDLELTAIWKADKEITYTMRYDLNAANSNGLLDPDEYPYPDDISDNTEHFTTDEELWTIEKAFGRLDSDITDMFIGWNTSPSGNGTMYYPGDDLDVTQDDNIVVNDGIIRLYAIWAHKNESTLVLVHNYPNGYTGGTEDDVITQDNLTGINLSEESGMTYHQEIQFTDAGGTDHTYRFDGWSTNRAALTDADVNIAADETIKVDTLYTSEGINYLYAVWLEVHEITVTKEVVDAVNYSVPDDQTFTFTWSFVDGEGNINTNEDSIVIADKETFTIPDVATGESVTIIETPVEGFTVSYNGAHINVEDDGKGTCTFTMDENSQEITVYNTVDTTKILITKIWQDGGTDHNEDIVKAVVMENGTQIGDELILDSQNGWITSIDVVIKENCEYTVEESAVPAGYDAKIDGDVESGFTITNTKLYTPEDDPTPADPEVYGRITITKIWDDADDQDGIRPSDIDVTLLANGNKATDVDGNDLTLIWVKNIDTWTSTAANLPGYDADGRITYTVSEAAMGNDGYTTAYNPVGADGGTSSGEISDGTVNIINSHTPETVDISGTKIWADNSDQDGKRPGSITVNLMNGADIVDSRTIIVNKENTLTYTFNDVPKNAGGTEINYTVSEIAVEDYSTEYSGYDITNSYKPSQTSVQVTKSWDDEDDQDGIRPESVTITLVKDGMLTDQTLTLDESNHWTSSFTELDEYSNGIKIEYTVEETDFIDSKGNSKTYKPSVTGNASGGFVITNSHTPDLFNGDGVITVTKVWDDDSDRDGIRPETIDVNLFANGSVVTDANGEPTQIEWTDIKDNTWTGIFNNLPKNADGHEIQYTVEEQPVTDKNYKTDTYEIEIIQDTRAAFTITNKHDPELINEGEDPEPGSGTAGKLTVTKVWDDQDNKYKIQPDSVTIQLMADNKPATNASGDEIGPVELNESNSWTVTFEDLYKNDNGKEIVYSVEEIDPGEFYELAVNKVASDDGTYYLEAVNKLVLEFFPIDEEIIPNNDGEEDPDSWVDQESVNEYDAIQVEMSTTLPMMRSEMLKEDQFTMKFHGKLDTGLNLDMLKEDFSVDLNGEPIDPKYYSIDTTSTTLLSRIISLFNITDGCTFHVSIDLTGLYDDGLIGDDDLGTSTIRIFFMEELDDLPHGVNRSYQTEAWYDVSDNREILYTSESRFVKVYTFEIIVNTYDRETNETIYGASYGLYYDEECTIPVSRNGEDYIAGSDENGQAVFIGIAEGTYYVKQLIAPDGYDINDKLVAVTLSGSADGDHIVEIVFTNGASDDGDTGDDESDPGTGGSSSPDDHTTHNGGGGSSGGTHSGITTGSDGGPGVDSEGIIFTDLSGYEYFQDENGNWVLARTGESTALLFGASALAISSMVLAVLLWMRKKEA